MNKEITIVAVQVDTDKLTCSGCLFQSIEDCNMFALGPDMVDCTDGYIYKIKEDK